MANTHDFSTAAQYAALGAALCNPPRKTANPSPISLSSLAGLGRYVGAANNHPKPAPQEEPILSQPAQHIPADEDLLCDA